jgi:hypothetical protein
VGVTKDAAEIRRGIEEADAFNETALGVSDYGDERPPWKGHWFEAWTEHARARICPVFEVVLGFEPGAIEEDSDIEAALFATYVSGWNACLSAVAKMLGTTTLDVEGRLEEFEEP